MPLHNTGPGEAVTVRAARPDEVERITAAATTIFRAPGAGDMGRDYPLLFDPANAGHLWFAERAGEVVAHAGFCLTPVRLLGDLVRVASFGVIFTTPAERSHGLATEVLARAVADARAAGAQLGLVSGSRSLYRLQGFVGLPRTAFQVVGPPEDGEGPSALACAPAVDADVDALVALHAAEPIHFVRSAAQWRRLLAAGTVLYGPGQVLLVRREGRPVAYAALEGKPANLPGVGPVLRAVELAGDRGALIAALVGLARPPGTGLALVALPHDRALAREAAVRRWPLGHARLALSAVAWDAALVGAPLPWCGLNYV